MKRLIIFLLTLIILPAFASPSLAIPPDGHKLNSFSQEAYAGIKERELLSLINSYRLENGLRLLKEDLLLKSYANRYAEELAYTDVFEHSSPDRIRNVLKHASWTIAGENLGRVYHDPKTIMEKFKLSPTHNANMLIPAYNTIGISYYENERGFPFWTVEFARVKYVEP